MNKEKLEGMLEELIKEIGIELPDFKIVIDKKHTELKGTEPALLTGLSILVNALKESNIDPKQIEFAVKIGLKEEK